ncbi:MAG: hypothetical protein IJC33_04790 [Clostridia bacterium]|nr:hypothetical protein [Clostridia bacterium]
MKSKKASRVASLLALLAVVSMLLAMFGGCGKKPEPDVSTPVKDDVSTSTTTTTEGDVSDDTTTGDVSDDTTTGDVSGDTTTGDVSGNTTTDNSGSGSTTSGNKTTKPTKTFPTTKPTTKNPVSGPIVSTSSTTKTTKSSATVKTTAPVGSEEDILAKVPANLKGQNVKVLVWWGVSDDGEDSYKAKLFKERTGINVSFESITMDKYQSRLSAMLMSNIAPSCAAISSEWYPQPITRGLMQPISNTKWDFTQKIFATKLMDQFAYKGEQYGIALKGSQMTTFNIIFWNKEMFAQKKITTTPETLWKSGNWNWDTFLDVAKKVSNPAQGQYALTATYQNYWMLSAGQDFVMTDENGLVNNVKNEKLLDAWYFAWDILHTHKIQNPAFADRATFIGGTDAMYASGSYNMQSALTDGIPANCKFEWGVVPFPSPKGIDPVSACEGVVFGFPAGRDIKDDKLQAAAWFLRFYLDDKAYTSNDFYPSKECWDLIDALWEQDIQSFNSIGVLTYGGEYGMASVQYNLLEEAPTRSQVKSNIDAWYSVFNANINKILNE